ncbi:MAG: hydroxymethylglutaryl-CoA reductase [Bacteroidia bacterium]|nr:hydroxymethylglutaryl-CoA reductase [Bacteroidia bacterium]
MKKLPYSKVDDYNESQASARRTAIKDQTGVDLKHIGGYSIPPEVVSGNIEMFTGVAQVPLGFAGPLKVNGEHANGQFYIPMATSEGTLLASYNRGMKIASLAGGVKSTVLDDAMNRGAGFTFHDARAARRFGVWVKSNFQKIKEISEETTSVGKLLNIGQYAVGKLRFIRFNFSTGDAAGQNMVNKAAHRACQWILQNQPEEVEAFKFGSQFDSDKKHSLINALTVRGKKVVAECLLPRQLMKDVLRTTPEDYNRFKSTSTLEAYMAQAVTNTSHIANGITALFIATGQDVANVAESSAGYYHGEINKDGDLYMSVTIPALIVATYGGGTGLPTQRECLEVMDCYGTGKVNKLAEIAAAVALCGEISLGSAILADEFVSSHDHYGRNRD